MYNEVLAKVLGISSMNGDALLQVMRSITDFSCQDEYSNSLNVFLHDGNPKKSCFQGQIQ